MIDQATVIAMLDCLRDPKEASVLDANLFALHNIYFKKPEPREAPYLSTYYAHVDPFTREVVHVDAHGLHNPGHEPSLFPMFHIPTLHPLREWEKDLRGQSADPAIYIFHLARPQYGGERALLGEIVTAFIEQGEPLFNLVEDSATRAAQFANQNTALFVRRSPALANALREWTPGERS